MLHHIPDARSRLAGSADMFWVLKCALCLAEKHACICAAVQLWLHNSFPENGVHMWISRVTNAIGSK